MYEIIPSPGTENKDWSEIEEKINIVRPLTKTIHIDVVDGIYAPNTTFADADAFKDVTKDFKFEIHLMVDEPVRHLQKWADAGFQRFIGQIEKMSDQAEFVTKAEELGEVVLALDKQSSVDEIKVPLDDLDGLLVMTIQAGFSGQKFEETLLEKVKQIREKADYFPIEVDGGINDQTILKAAQAGANRFVATSFIFSAESPEKQFQLLSQSLQAIKS